MNAKSAEQLATSIRNRFDVSRCSAPSVEELEQERERAADREQLRAHRRPCRSVLLGHEGLVALRGANVALRFLPRRQLKGAGVRSSYGIMLKRCRMQLSLAR